MNSLSGLKHNIRDCELKLTRRWSITFLTCNVNKPRRVSPQQALYETTLFIMQALSALKP